MDKKPIHTWIIFEYLLSLDLIIIYIYSSLLPIIWAILDRLKKNFTMEVKTRLAVEPKIEPLSGPKHPENRPVQEPDKIGKIG